LRIEPGTKVIIGRDVALRIEGALKCGGNADGNVSMKNTVIFENTEERLSGMIELINCRNAVFNQTIFRDLGLGAEAIYSQAIFNHCEFNNTGLGILSYESRIRLKCCRFIFCDMGCRLVRSEVNINNTQYLDNLQSLMMHSEIWQIGSYYKFKIDRIDKLETIIEKPQLMEAQIQDTIFYNTGIGVAATSLENLVLLNISLDSCKKGLSIRDTKGEMKKCQFHMNKMDYEIFGIQRFISTEKNTGALNFTLYNIHNIRVADDKGLPVSRAQLRLNGQNILEHRYISNDNGQVSNITLLWKSAENGRIADTEGYNISIVHEDFQGHYFMRKNETDLTITPSSLSDDVKEEENEMGKEGCLVILGIFFLTAIIYLFLLRKKKKD